MRTAFIVLALATVCFAAAIEKTADEKADSVIPVAVTYDSDASVSDVAANAPLSRSKRAPLLLAKLKLAKLGLLGLGALKVAKVAKVAVLGAGVVGIAGLAGRGGGNNGGGNYHGGSSYNGGASYSGGYSQQQPQVYHATVVHQSAPAPVQVPHQTYGPASFSAHKEYVVSYNQG